MKTKHIIKVYHLKTPMLLYAGKGTNLVASKQEAYVFLNKKDLDLATSLWKSCELITAVEEVNSE